MQKETIPAKDFNVKRYLGTLAYEAKREEMQKELNFNSVLFNRVKGNEEKYETNARPVRGIGENHPFYKSPEERDALRKEMGKGKQNKKTGIIH